MKLSLCTQFFSCKNNQNCRRYKYFGTIPSVVSPPLKRFRAFRSSEKLRNHFIPYERNNNRYKNCTKILKPKDSTSKLNNRFSIGSNRAEQRDSKPSNNVTRCEHSLRDLVHFSNSNDTFARDTIYREYTIVYSLDSFLTERVLSKSIFCKF